MIHRAIEVPLEKQLIRLIENLGFMKRFRFDQKTKVVLFDNASIFLEPFLNWNGHIIERFSSLICRSGETPKVVYSHWSERIEKSVIRQVEPEAERALVKLATLYNIEGWGVPNPEQEALPQSVMPLFADSYPTLIRLAHKLVNSADHSMRESLWVDPSNFLSSERKEEIINNEVFLTNAVIHKCLDEDPINVLQQYFMEEPHDAMEYFRWVLPDEGAVKKVMEEVNVGTDRYKAKLRAFYLVDQDDNIRDQARKFRARLIAKRLVQFLGFPIAEEHLMEDITDFQRRIKAFNYYLATSETVDWNKAKQGLSECTKEIEVLLGAIILFYYAARHYNPEEPSGLSILGRDDALSFGQSLSTFGLGQKIGALSELNKDPTLLNMIQKYLGRTSIWPSDSGKFHLETLNMLNHIRIEKGLAHQERESLLLNDIIGITDRLVQFIHWLSSAEPDSATGKWRIYPAILGLDVITTNSCGIVSMKYRLKEIKQDKSVSRKITLYTSQPLSFDSGTYYGLPHSGRALYDLWVDPVLISAKNFPND